MKRSDRRYVSMPEAAAYAGVNEKTIRRGIAAGRFKGYRFGSKLIRVDLNEIDAAFERIPAVGGPHE